MGVDPKIAVAVLYPIGAIISFFGNKEWTFSYQGHYLPSFRRFINTHVFGYLLNLSLIYYFVDIMGFRHEIIQAIAIFVVAGFLFIAFKLYVFSADKNTDQGLS